MDFEEGYIFGWSLIFYGKIKKSLKEKEGAEW